MKLNEISFTIQRLKNLPPRSPKDNRSLYVEAIAHTNGGHFQRTYPALKEPHSPSLSGTLLRVYRQGKGPYGLVWFRACKYRTLIPIVCPLLSVSRDTG
jgi:hypothetical protein